MSVISKSRTALCTALSAGALLLTTVPGCGAFGPHQSKVAQGKYYSSGDPRYDEFFIGLFVLQIQMGEAPSVPAAERRALAQALQLPADTAAAGIGQRLREEALKLSRAGVHLRLEQNPSSDKPETASVVIRSNARPKENPTASLLAQVESSGTTLLSSIGEMKLGEAALGKLEISTVGLDAGIATAFSQAPFGKQSEVKTNLADAHKLISLMRARAEEVRGASQQLLDELSRAVNTDDGSFSAAPTGEAANAEPNADAAKKTAKSLPAHPKPKATNSPVPAARPKPAPLVSPAVAPAKPPAAATKAPPAPRDFEP